VEKEKFVENFSEWAIQQSEIRSNETIQTWLSNINIKLKSEISFATGKTVG
jgi:hypothetical protein